MPQKRYSQFTFMTGQKEEISSYIPKEINTDLKTVRNFTINKYGALSRKPRPGEAVATKDIGALLSGISQGDFNPSCVSSARYDYEDNTTNGSVDESWMRMEKPVAAGMHEDGTLKFIVYRNNPNTGLPELLSKTETKPDAAAVYHETEDSPDEIQDVNVVLFKPGVNTVITIFVRTNAWYEWNSTDAGGTIVSYPYYYIKETYENSGEDYSVNTTILQGFINLESDSATPSKFDISLETSCAGGLHMITFVRSRLIVVTKASKGYIYASAQKPASVNYTYPTTLQPFENFSYFTAWDDGTGKPMSSDDAPQLIPALPAEEINMIEDLRGVFIGTDIGIYHSQEYIGLSLNPEKISSQRVGRPRMSAVIADTLYFVGDNIIYRSIYDTTGGKFSIIELIRLSSMVKSEDPTKVVSSNYPYESLIVSYLDEGLMFIGRVFGDQMGISMHTIPNSRDISYGRMSSGFRTGKAVNQIIAMPNDYGDGAVDSSVADMSMRIVGYNIASYGDPGYKNGATPMDYLEDEEIFDVTSVNVGNMYTFTITPKAVTDMTYLRADSYNLVIEYDGNYEIIDFQNPSGEYVWYAPAGIQNITAHFGVQRDSILETFNLLITAENIGKIYSTLITLVESAGFTVDGGDVSYEHEPINSDHEIVSFTGKYLVETPTGNDDYISVKISCKTPSSLNVMAIGVNYEPFS